MALLGAKMVGDNSQRQPLQSCAAGAKALAHRIGWQSIYYVLLFYPLQFPLALIISYRARNPTGHQQ